MQKTMNERRVLSLVVLMIAGIVQTGCATSPAGRLDRIAVEHGLRTGVVKGNGFRLRYYRKGAVTRGESVRIYLEGDGLPWLRPRQVARDPTTRNPVALRLMLHDPGPAVYLARPCYHQMDDHPLCMPWHWTAGRYSRTIVDSLTAAIRTLTKARPSPFGIGLVGYSGGGALAMLIAERLPRVDHVITIAGNIDPDTWTDLHGYSPLSGSENPSLHPPLRGSILQLHLAGENDENLPPSLIGQAVERQGNGSLVTIARYNHHCCWQDIWPYVLESQAGGMSLCELPHEDAPGMQCLQLNTRVPSGESRISP